MNQKLIFLDIDGTLVAAMAEPSALAAKAIQGARGNGHKVFLCTGRNMPIIGSDILSVGFDGIIASAGLRGRALRFFPLISGRHGGSIRLSMHLPC